MSPAYRKCLACQNDGQKKGCAPEKDLAENSHSRVPCGRCVAKTKGGQGEDYTEECMDGISDAKSEYKLLTEGFLALAPLFKNVINTESLYACLKGDKTVKRHTALQSAIAAMAYWRMGAKIESQKQVELARREVDSILDSGLVRQIAVDVLPTLTILLYYHLHKGIWLQNSILSTQVMALCNNSCLYLDDGQLPPGGYPIEPADRNDLHVDIKGLFWVVYILYIQVTSCSFPTSLSLIMFTNISQPLPSNLPAESRQPRAGDSDLYTNHLGLNQFGFYAKSAILLGRTQEMVRRILIKHTVGGHLEQADIIEINKIYTDVWNFRLGWKLYEDGQNQLLASNNENISEAAFLERMTICAMVAGCYLLPREANVYEVYGNHAPYKSAYDSACSDVEFYARYIMSRIQSQDEGFLRKVEPYVIHTWMLVARSYRHNQGRNELPRFDDGSSTIRKNLTENARNCIFALNTVAKYVPAAGRTLLLLWDTIDQMYSTDWKASMAPQRQATKKDDIDVSEVEASLGALSFGQFRSPLALRLAAQASALDMMEHDDPDWEVFLADMMNNPNVPLVHLPIPSDDGCVVEEHDRTESGIDSTVAWPPAGGQHQNDSSGGAPRQNNWATSGLGFGL